MRIHGLALIPPILAATLAAQAPPPNGTSDPMAIVARAEALLQKNETESAVLALWRALDVLADQPRAGTNESVAQAARQLLAANDPLDARRRAVFASVAKQQVELAALYRGKKWFDVAATRLAVAERFDPDGAAKERALLTAALPKAPADPATPAGGATQLAPLLQRANAEFVSGEWREVDDCLEIRASEGKHHEWVTKATHADHEVVVEFRPTQPEEQHNASLAVGLFLDDTHSFSGFRLQCSYDPRTKQYGLVLWRIRGMSFDKLAAGFVPARAGADGFHRLAVQVSGTRLRGMLDNEKAVDAEIGQAVQGKVGVMHGLSNAPTCAVQFRRLRVDPLPADQPTDDELRSKAAAATQNAITKDVDDAKALIAKKQPEPASALLRTALARIRSMPAGVLRDNLEKSTEQLLVQTDPFTARRKKTASSIAAELVGLANEYEKAGLVRAAEVVVRAALDFDPTLTAREAAAREAVQKWNAAQAAARAADLAPPADDGATLREWFGKGRKLFRDGATFVLEGPAARAENLQNSEAAFWVAAPNTRPAAKVRIAVHLPVEGADAGLCFDVADPTSFGLVVLTRTAAGLRLGAYQYAADQWTPLLRRDLEMDAWRRDGWHQLQVHVTAEGLVARCNDVELKVARRLLGKHGGTFALYANNPSPEPVTVELRAFQVEP